MAGTDRVEAERYRAVEHGCELDLLVAPQTRIRRAAVSVLTDEVLDDVGVESFGHVPYVERNADDIGGAPGVTGVLECAAAARPATVRARVTGQRKMHAGDVMTSGRRPGGGDSRVDATRHSSKNAQSSH